MRITDKDRELAAELVELLTDGMGDALTVKCVSVILASHRATSAAVGRCGTPNKPLGRGVAPVHCDLPAGHAGWHKMGDGHTSVATEWSR